MTKRELKMATNSDSELTTSNSSYLEDFETNIDENEAENDLTELLLSDDELFVDMLESEAAGMEGVVSQPSQPAPRPSGSEASVSDGAMRCRKCQREYKRRHFLDKHEKTCQGAQRKGFKQSKPKDAADCSKVGKESELLNLFLFVDFSLVLNSTCNQGV